MARKPMEMIRTDAELKFPDNTTGEISPADLRSWALDLVDTMTPGYGVLTIDNPPLVQNIGIAAEVLTAYDTVTLETEPFLVNQANGTVQALVDIVADISVNLSAEFAQGRELILTMYRGNSPVDYSAEVDGEGNGNPVSLALSGVLNLTAGQIVDIRAQVDGSSGINVTFTRNVFTVRAVPRREAP